MAVFHLAYTVKDLDSSRNFYGELLGCSEGRSADTWVDYNFFGHQLSLHLGDAVTPSETLSKIDGISVPMPHFGCVLEWQEFQLLAEKITSEAVDFVIEPHLRFARLPGEQVTMFIQDPSGNAIEFKAYRNTDEVFKS